MRLTPTSVTRLPPGIHRDWKVRGLFVEANERFGSFKIQGSLYGPTGRKDIRMTLGRTTDLTLEQARDRAEDILRRIRAGDDPRVQSEEQTTTVRQMYERNAKRLQFQRASAAHIANVKANAERHLGDWMEMPLARITPAMVADRHDRLVDSAGPSAARHTFREFSAAWNHARKRLALPESPTKAITFVVPPEDEEPDAIPFGDLPRWWEETAKLDRLRCHLQRFGLLAGLRPGNLVSTRSEWVDLENRCVHYPRLKSKRKFDLPLSEPMIEIIKQAMAIAPGRPLVFFVDEAKSDAKRWRQKHGWLAGRTGHILRHTYISIAASLGVDKVHRMLLVDHTIPGISGTYIEEKVLFARLMEEQEQISKRILTLARAEGVG